MFAWNWYAPAGKIDNMHWQCSLCQGSAFYQHYLAISMYTWKCFLLSLLVPFHSQFPFFSISHNYTKKQTFWVFFSLRLLSWTRSEPLICTNLCWGTKFLINNQLQLIFHHFIWTGPLHSWENRMTNYFTNLDKVSLLSKSSFLPFQKS